MKQKAVKYDLDRKTDSDKLVEAGVKSPCLEEMKFCYFDAQRRITYYFQNEERYMRFKEHKQSGD